MTTHTVFVYGSLMSGFHNHRLLADAVFVGNARTKEAEFTMIDLGAFPGVIASGAAAVVGEVWQVDEKTLADLDRLEGHPTFYRRHPTAVVFQGGEDHGRAVIAWMYHFVGRVKVVAPVPGGDWRRHRKAAGRW